MPGNLQNSYVKPTVNLLDINQFRDHSFHTNL